MQEQFLNLHISSSSDYIVTQLNENQLPNRLVSMPKLTHLDSLLMKNFKSFKNNYIGPFLNWTSVIGSNGSGKSNVSDAITFCLCGEISRRIYSDYKDLFTRTQHHTFSSLKDQNLICSVQCNFKTTTRQYISLRRSINTEGDDKFQINYQQYSRKQYENFLIRNGINVLVSNYGIKQGEVQKLLLKEPHKLMEYFQCVSGSIFLKKQYDTVKEELDVTKDLIEKRSKKLNKLRTEKKSIKNIKLATIEANKIQEEYNDIVTKIAMAKIKVGQMQLEKAQKDFLQLKESEKREFEEIQREQLVAQKQLKKKKDLQTKIQTLNAQIRQKQFQINSANQSSLLLKKKQFEDIELKIIQNKQVMEVMWAKKDLLSKQIPSFHSNDLVEEYLEVEQKYQRQNAEVMKDITRKRGQILYIEGLRQTKQNILEDYNDKKNNVIKTEEQNRINILKIQQDLKQLQKERKKQEIQVDRLRTQFRNGENQIISKTEQLSQLEIEFNHLSNQGLQGVEQEKQKDLIKTLLTIQGFKGALEQKIRPISSRYEVCFSLMFQAYGKYLLSDNQASMKRIGNKLRQMKKQRTVVILQNTRDTNYGQIKKFIGSAKIAMEIVQFDNNLKGLQWILKKILEGKVVCVNLKEAMDLKKKKIQGVKQIYTLDGNIIRNGLISSYGDTKVLEKNYKYSLNKGMLYQDIQKLSDQRIKLQNEISRLKIKYNVDSLQKKQFQLAKINQKKQSLNNKLKMLVSFKAKQIPFPKAILQQIQQLSQKSKKLNDRIVQIQRIMQQTDYFKNFMNKHKIESLETFRHSMDLSMKEKNMKERKTVLNEINEISRQIDKINKNIERWNEQLIDLNKEMDKILSVSAAGDIKKRIKVEEEELAKLSEECSKIIINKPSRFQSKTNKMELELELMKEKHQKLIEEIEQEYGYEFIKPQNKFNKVVEEIFGIPINRITIPKIQNFITELQDDKEKVRKSLEDQSHFHTITNLQINQTKVQTAITQLNTQLNHLTETRKQLLKRIEILTDQRKTILLTFIQQIRPILSHIYSILTMQKDGFSGLANLIIQNPDLPFEYGVYYTPTPPTKRFFYDLSQLSGGEKSIASLALQYSISIVSKSPFLLLDETDAFLDRNNLERLRKLLKETLDKDSSLKIQVIVITHKQRIFQRSTSLVGITKPKDINLSEGFSLILDQSYL